MKKTLLFISTILLGVTLNAQVKLDSGLVACYPFSGNANDMTGNGHNASVHGATLTADRFGTPNSAYMFYNDTASYMTVPNFNTILTSNDISISFWCQANSNTSDQPFLATPDSSADRFGIAANYTGVGAIWDYGNWISGGGRMSYNTGYSSSWEHYVYQVSKTKNIKEIFLNGVLIDSSAYVVDYNPKGKTLHIGGATSWANSWLGFPGAIDDIRIYNRALTDTEVVTLYNAPLEGISCSPQGVNDIDNNQPYIYSPAPGQVRMAFSKTAFNGTLAVYNMMGQMVDQRTLNAAPNAAIIYNLKPGVASGMYILSLTSATAHYSFKFIK